MSIKKEKISMPTSQAGIFSFAPDIDLEGINIDPKTAVIVIVLFIILIRVVSIVFPL